VRDAAGTALAIYREGQIREHTIYGASRLGVYYRANNNSVYQLTDHLGNVRAVVERSGSNAIAIVNTDYYPFGMPMPNRNLEGNYRYKYQGQEVDPETGKEAFELRLWDSRIGRWLTTDPAGQFSSPYLGMGNNPVNGIDPDGGTVYNPVYGSNGTFKGTTKEGFTGEPIIYDGDKDFSKLQAEQLINSGGKLLSKFNFSSENIVDKIINHVVNRDLKDGLSIPESICVQNCNLAGKRHFNFSAKIATKDNLAILRGLDKDGNSIANQFYEPTVENLRSTINLHESVGHTLSDIRRADKHYLIFKSQIDHSSFHKTTDNYKGATIYNFYRTARNANFTPSKKYYDLYNKYVPQFLERLEN
jgi:RHS repeat-associated protein